MDNRPQDYVGYSRYLASRLLYRTRLRNWHYARQFNVRNVGYIGFPAFQPVKLEIEKTDDQTGELRIETVPATHAEGLYIKRKGMHLKKDRDAALLFGKLPSNANSQIMTNIFGGDLPLLGYRFYSFRAVELEHCCRMEIIFPKPYKHYPNRQLKIIDGKSDQPKRATAPRVWRNKTEDLHN